MMNKYIRDETRRAPQRRGEGRLLSTVPRERKGETPLRDPIRCNDRRTKSVETKI
jgi:hypothetical protein